MYETISGVYYARKILYIETENRINENNYLHLSICKNYAFTLYYLIYKYKTMESNVCFVYIRYVNT